MSIVVDQLSSRVSGILLGWLILCFTTSVSFAQTAEILAELDREQIYEGESVRYTVMLNHVANPSRPTLEGFEDFDVQPAGERSVTSITSFNGRRSERRGQSYDFLLTPKRAGLLEVPSPTTEIDGRTIRGRALTLEVIAPQEQDVAILEMTADPAAVYPMQSFTIRLNVAVKALPDRWADSDPMSLLPQPPALSIPWVDDEELPAGIEAKLPWDRWLRPLICQRGGFAINNIRDRSGGMLGSLFGDARATAFSPQPRRTIREDQLERKVDYWEYMLERSFVSSTVGTMHFGPVTLKGTFGTGTDTRGDLRGQRIYAVARPVEVVLKEPPVEGRPDSYLGAIGKFTAGAELSSARAKVGDPMTLTLWLRGEGTLDRAIAPRLEQLDAVSEAFKVYEATEETQGDERRFTYSVRPKQAEIKEFPAIALSYFDVAQEQYVTLNTDPIGLEISPAEHLSKREIAMARPTNPVEQAIETSAKGLFANVTDLHQLRDESVQPEDWFLGLGGIAGVFLMLAVTVQLIQRHGADPAIGRRHSAAARARGRMHDALRGFGAGDRRKATDQLGTTLIGLVADTFNIPESGLTSTDAARQLAQAELDTALIQRFSSLLDACDHVRYGASAQAIDSIRDQFPELLDELTTALKRKKLL